MEDEAKSAELVSDLGIMGGISFLVGLVLIIIGWRLAIIADMSDPDNMNKPIVRF